MRWRALLLIAADGADDGGPRCFAHWPRLRPNALPRHASRIGVPALGSARVWGSDTAPSGLSIIAAAVLAVEAVGQV